MVVGERLGDDAPVVEHVPRDAKVDPGVAADDRRAVPDRRSQEHAEGSAALATAMERLARLSHRVVWVNPHAAGDAEYVPASLGMVAATPFVDEVLPGGDLRSLERFAARLPRLG